MYGGEEMNELKRLWEGSGTSEKHQRQKPTQKVPWKICFGGTVQRKASARCNREGRKRLPEDRRIFVWCVTPASSWNWSSLDGRGGEDAGENPCTVQRNGSGIKISRDSSYEDCHGFLFVYSLPTKTLWENIEDVEKAVKNKKQKKKTSKQNARKPWDIWRRGWDSNPRYIAAHLISSQAPSTTRTPLLKGTVLVYHIFFRL